MQFLVLLLATVLGGNVSKNIIGLGITVGKAL